MISTTGNTHSASLYLLEKAMMRMPKGIRQVPNTLTTRKFWKRTWKPSFWRARAYRRAAILACSSLVAPVHVTRPDDQMDAVVYGRRSFIVTIPFSRRNSTLTPFNAICLRFRWHFTLKLHTTLFIMMSISGVSSSSATGSAGASGAGAQGGPAAAPASQYSWSGTMCVGTLCVVMPWADTTPWVPLLNSLMPFSWMSVAMTTTACWKQR